VNKADAPILLIFGRDDSVVSINQSRDMAVSLRGAGKPVEVLQLAGEDHWLSARRDPASRCCRPRSPSWKSTIRRMAPAK